ncbi:hypothetical protein H9L10_02960 [Phycicoccus endophyticus]|uniref:DUF2568 domain-containing protein n=1 Tax=Phycicoccus endophyticus TaxID=1690220 RepID=A0A7G9R5L2_9MICO|nr:hypothetical protein [Phycicoccus endophyticus]QNN50887.1 hypothetical protein H9L10_02960 [Phycicoccus endophyticus]
MVAAAACVVEALALAGFAAFYLYELARGEGSDAARVAMSAVTILLGAAGLAALARGWLGAARWPRTPTVVVNLLLLPVGVSLLQAGRPVLGVVVLALAVVALGATVAARVPDPGGGDPS